MKEEPKKKNGILAGIKGFFSTNQNPPPLVVKKQGREVINRKIEVEEDSEAERQSIEKRKREAGKEARKTETLARLREATATTKERNAARRNRKEEEGHSSQTQPNGIPVNDGKSSKTRATRNQKQSSSSSRRLEDGDNKQKHRERTRTNTKSTGNQVRHKSSPLSGNQEEVGSRQQGTSSGGASTFLGAATGKKEREYRRTKRNNEENRQRTEKGKRVITNVVRKIPFAERLAKKTGVLQSLQGTLNEDHTREISSKIEVLLLIKDELETFQTEKTAQDQNIQRKTTISESIEFLDQKIGEITTLCSNFSNHNDDDEEDDDDKNTEDGGTPEDKLMRKIQKKYDDAIEHVYEEKNNTRAFHETGRNVFSRAFSCCFYSTKSATVNKYEKVLQDVLSKVQVETNSTQYQHYNRLFGHNYNFTSIKGKDLDQYGGKEAVDKAQEYAEDPAPGCCC